MRSNVTAVLLSHIQLGRLWATRSEVRNTGVTRVGQVPLLTVLHEACNTAWRIAQHSLITTVWPPTCRTVAFKQAHAAQLVASDTVWRTRNITLRHVVWVTMYHES